MLYKIKVYNKIYLERYIKFINHYQTKEIFEKFETHHILPKSIFPEYKNTKENLIKLPYRAHYIAHFMLAKIFKDKMIYAFNLMCNKNTKNGRINKYNSILYENNKKEFSKSHSLWHKQDSSIDGLTNAQLIGIKIKETKNTISSDYYTQISKRSAETMMLTIQENGLTIAQNRSLKSAETIKQNGSLIGSKSSNAKVIQIYDNIGNLVYEFFGDFFKKCKELNLPGRALKLSYLNNGSPIYPSKYGETTAKRKGFEQYIGWSAICVCRTRDYNQ